MSNRKHGEARPLPGLVLRESITGRSYQNQRRAKLNAVPKAIFTSYLAFLLAIYLIGLPLHGFLQKYLPFVYLLGWTEYAQLLSLPLIAFAFLRNEFSFTRKVAAVAYWSWGRVSALSPSGRHASLGQRAFSGGIHDQASEAFCPTNHWNRCLSRRQDNCHQRHQTYR